MNWLVITCICILVALGLIGLKLGVVKMVYYLVAFALALILTAIVAPIISKVLVKEDSPSVIRVKEKVTDKLNLDDIHFDKTVTKEILDDLKIPESIREELGIYNTEDAYKDLGVENAKDYVATSLATIILQAVIYLITFLVIWLLVFLAFMALNLIANAPGLRAANRLAGMAVGLLMGACFIFILFVFATATANLDIGQNMMSCIEQNSVLKYWYDHNPLNGGFVTLSGILKK